MEDIDSRLRTAAQRFKRAEAAAERARNDLRDLMIEARQEHDLGPSQIARLTGYTREWVAKLAPLKDG